MRIYAPVKDFNGMRNSVRFVDGVGETNNPQLIEWFHSRGYKIEGQNAERAITNPVDVIDRVLEDVEETPPDFNKMTPLELRDWMKANGYGREIKNIRDKEKLLKIIRG